MATDTAATATATAPRYSGPDPTTYFWQVPVFLLGAAVFVAAWQGWLPLGTPDPAADFTRELATLRGASERPQTDRQELKELLAQAAANVDAFPEVAADARFTLGSGYARLAELTVPLDEARNYWTLAKQHFELVKSEQLRDPGDAAKLAFRSAKARVAVGFPTGTPAADLKLHIALLANAPFGEEMGEAGRLRADLALKLTPPDVATATSSLAEYLQKTGIATPTASLARAKLTLGDLHIRKNEIEQARKWLSEIGADSPPEVLAQGKMLLARVKIKDGADWLGAARDLESLRALPQGVSPALRAASAYHLALCKANTREPDAAAKLYEEAAKGTGPEAVAASVGLAELYLKGSDPAKRATVPALLETVVKGVSDSKSFRNPFVLVTDVQRVFELANATLLDDGAHEAALKVADTYATLSAAGREREMRAETLAAWAQSLDKAKGDSKPKATDAAAEYEALAGLQPAVTVKAEMLTRAAKMHRLAGNPAKAVEIVQTALRLPQLPDAAVGALWTELADHLIAAKRPVEVVGAFNQILASGPVSTATRYRLALQFTESRHPGYAPLGRALFEQIAKQETVTPAEQEFQERALVELGHDFIRGGKFGEAEVWLRKGLSTYPTGPESLLGRLLLGVCLLQRSSAPPTPGTDPASAAANATALRQDALKLFKQITADTEAKLARDKKLNERDGWLRLQAGLRVLQTYQQLQLPNELLAEASPLLERHRGTIEELIVWSLVYHAFKQKGETGRALQTRDRMKELFDRLPASAFPAGATGEYSRKYWEDVWFAGK